MPNKYLDSVQLGRLITKIKNHVSTSIADLVGSAPGTLDTLQELATALGNDPNFATTIATLIDTKCAQAKAEALLAAHPVGSYYWSDDSTSPATLFGGTWQALPAGYTLIAQGSGTDSFGSFTYTAGQTYGERMHKLTVGELAAHEHVERMPFQDSQHRPWSSDLTGTSTTPGNNKAFKFSTGVVSFLSSADSSKVISTETSGNSNAHNNIQPVKAAYCWKRTA